MKQNIGEHLIAEPLDLGSHAEHGNQEHVGALGEAHAVRLYGESSAVLGSPQVEEPLRVSWCGLGVSPSRASGEPVRSWGLPK